MLDQRLKKLDIGNNRRNMRFNYLISDFFCNFTPLNKMKAFSDILIGAEIIPQNVEVRGMNVSDFCLLQRFSMKVSRHKVAETRQQVAVKSIRTAAKSIRTVIKSIRTVVKSIRTAVKSIRTAVKSIRTAVKSILTAAKSIRTTAKSIRIIAILYIIMANKYVQKVISFDWNHCQKIKILN
jgi:hypothetical protein